MLLPLSILVPCLYMHVPFSHAPRRSHALSIASVSAQVQLVAHALPRSHALSNASLPAKVQLVARLPCAAEATGARAAEGARCRDFHGGVPAGFHHWEHGAHQRSVGNAANRNVCRLLPE